MAPDLLKAFFEVFLDEEIVSGSDAQVFVEFQRAATLCELNQRFIVHWSIPRVVQNVSAGIDCYLSVAFANEKKFCIWEGGCK